MTGEGVVRLAVFAAVLVGMAIWEQWAPVRQVAASRKTRWTANLGLIVLDSALLRAAVPVTAVGVAAFCAQNGWGLFNVWSAPAAVEVGLAFVALDFAIYLQHVFFHAVPALWSLHAVHHSDTELDATTGVRFHPGEMLVSMGIKLALVVAIGPAPAAVVAFEIALNAGSLFSHANVRLPAGLERLLRFVIVTPSMHRVHHSAKRDETDSNFGFNLPWWDRLLGTYVPPSPAIEAGSIGLEGYRDAARLSLVPLLAMPFFVPRQAPRPPRQLMHTFDRRRA